ncbi:MAG: peptidase M24 family protein [Actinobacteria bacterium 69-20]|nr:aminopeptidase P family protein [Actinomycetota bacterium]OJV30900.1 MAG: peptidase M24 family protein [Actinobacteria bacterium 69-20]
MTSAPSTADLTDRFRRLAARAATAGADAVLITPGADMRYFLGHSVASHERLTCLVVPADGPAHLLVPALERLGWAGSPVEALGLPLTTWVDGQDPYTELAELLPSDARVLSVDYHMPAVHALGARGAVPGSELTLAGETIAELRMRKSPAEIAALQAVGEAIDRVHLRIGEWLRPGRTEYEVAADITAAILAEGHERADFVIVGSGPNGASPHHEASDRPIRAGEPVVIDIGGPAPDGYFSDCTRTYLTGGADADPEVREVYEVVRAAQTAGVAAAVAGATAESVDMASRTVVADAGYGDYFITRTGHGIGLEVHEHPYLVAGNTQVLEPGMAFSVEPGIYLPGRFGVRIEDIVVVTEDGPLLCNNAPTDLIVVG